jgi:predicted TIM-barrel fold metal-dependent hydrolase
VLHRRDFLCTAVALVAARDAISADAKPPVIDVHTHFYDPTRKEGVPWPGKDSKELYRPVLPAEFKKLAAPHGVTGTVVVEASPWVEDNQWLLDQAKDNDVIVGVVGRLLLTDADFVKHLARFAKNPLYRGIRVNEGEVREALKDEKQLDRLKALSDNGLSLDLNGGHETFLMAAKVADKLPKLRIVVNHMGNPLIDGKEPPEAWRKAVATGADASANIVCKLSALVDGTRKRAAAPTDLVFYTPVLDVIWKAFGADRLLYGSNWPVSDLYAKYATVYAIAAKYVEGKGKDATVKVFGTNAVKAYQLPKR